jgi:hypothetical protein
MLLEDEMICRGWPACMCARQCEEINAALDVMIDPALPPPMSHDVAEVKELSIVVLRCIARKCPDPVYRYVASDQLRLAVFAEQERENYA